ncbi:MAG: hypothetical protein ACTHJN_11815 [Ginsengibacter sp.]
MSLYKRSNYFFTVLVCLLLGNSSFAQTRFEKMVNNIAIYNVHYLEEKVYLHTDRSYYLCGDIIWFKAYVENATNNHPSSVSKVVYAELLNSSHDPVLQAKIKIANGNGSGSFALPLSLPSGNYELRAYTNWMKNDSAFHFFRKMITIINTTKNLDQSLVKTNTQYEAQFFPEGGNLVNGIKSLVAFKVNDNKGIGVNANGVIVDQSNDTIANFQTAHFGMGRFYLTPEAGKNYSAIVRVNDSATLNVPLPNAYNEGMVMHLSDQGNAIKIEVNSSGKSSSAVYLIASTNKLVDYSQALNLNYGNTVFTINKSDLSSGVSRITLFDENRKPVCERLYFKRPGSRLDINAKSDKSNYGKRDAVSVDLSTTAGSGNFLPGNLSASVYKLDDLQQANNDNIFTYLWLSSDIKGYVEDPEYYFKNNSAESNEALDNLLLTQGWRTFDWNESSIQDPSFSYAPENRGHIIMGKVTNESTGQPAANVLVYLSVPGRRVQLYGCKSDVEGNVHFDMKDFYGANQIVLQTNTTTDSTYRLQIFTPFSQSFSNESLPALTVSEENRESLAEENLHMQVSNAYHGEELQKEAPLRIDTMPFYYKPYKTYLLDNYTRFTTMEEVLREYVLEVNVLKREKQFHLETFNAPGFALLNMQPSEKMFTQDPLVLLDGVPVFDVNKIMEYDPLKVQKLEVVASKYVWGPIVSNGIVSFTTYKGDLPGYSLNPHDVILDYAGLQKQRVFYSPQYATEKERQSRLPDFREVLYWSPDINTDAKGKGQFSFYTGDMPGKYLVNIQGISQNGDAGGTNFTIEVK